MVILITCNIYLNIPVYSSISFVRLFIILNTVKPVLRGHIWDKEKLVF